MQAMAEKLREEAQARNAFDAANLKQLLAEKRAEEQEQRIKSERLEQRRLAQIALDKKRQAEIVKVQGMLDATGIDVQRQNEALGSELALRSSQYACVRMLEVLGLAQQPISDGVKASMKQHENRGTSKYASILSHGIAMSAVETL